VSFDEFQAAVAPLYDRSSAALRRSFDHFDTDGSGTISTEELERMLCKLGLAEEGDQVAVRMIRAADEDGDGQVSFEEFISLFKTRATTSIGLSTAPSGGGCTIWGPSTMGVGASQDA